MAFGKTLVALVALVSTSALVAASGCTDETTSTGGGGTGNTTSQGGGGTGGMNTGGMNTGGDGGAGGGTGGMGNETDCATLCADNIANCSGNDLQWVAGAASCEAFCTVWDQGTPGEMAGDTLECRAYHTGAAASDAATHCPHGGPYGGGVCGASQCETFCAAAQLLCTGTEAAFASEAECLTACGAFPDKDTPFVGDANSSGANLACRGYHLTAAALDPAVHCAHVAGTSGPCM